MVKIARVAPGICCRTEKQTDRQTDTHTHTDIHITIRRHRSSGRSKLNNTIAYPVTPWTYRSMRFIVDQKHLFQIVADFRHWHFKSRFMVWDASKWTHYRFTAEYQRKSVKIGENLEKVTGWWFSSKLEMWANAQRDIRPAEYRWRPLFKAAKFGWRPLLECSAVTLPRSETRWNLKGCP